MRRSSLFALFLVVCTASGHAAETTVEHPLEPAVTTSPRATLQTFLETYREAYDLVQSHGMRRGTLTEQQQDYYVNRIAGCLDLSDVPPALLSLQVSESSTSLKEVLDRIELPPEVSWPDEAEVDERELSRWTIPHTEITIAKVTEGEKAGEWLFSPSTVERAPEFYQRVQHLPYTDRATVTAGAYSFFHAEPGTLLPRNWILSLPKWAHKRPGGQAVWQWIGLACIMFLSLAIMAGAYVFGIRSSRSARESGALKYLATLLFPIVAMLVPLLTNQFIESQLRITGGLLVVLTYFWNVVFLFALMMFVLGIGSRLAALVIATSWIQPSGMDAQLVRLACRMASIAAAVVVVLEGGQQIGIPLTTLLAGAGVSGLAVALAAQDTLKNVFGSIMISLDKPYKVGERIVAKGYDGVVEEVGLRSTKIRLLTGHLTTIPNEEMARCDIENIGRRPSIRRVSDISIPLDTPPEKIDRAVKVVREVLEDHEGMQPDFPPRVFFNDFNRDSFNIRMIVWYHPADYWDFLAFSQRVNEEIVRRFAAEGIEFAPPTNVTLFSQTDERPPHVGDAGEPAHLPQ